MFNEIFKEMFDIITKSEYQFQLSVISFNTPHLHMIHHRHHLLPTN